MKIPEAEQKPRQICPAGLQSARLIWAIDLGHQEYQGDWNRKLLLSFETSKATAVFKEDRGPEPFVLSATFNFCVLRRDGQPTKLGLFVEQWMPGKPLADFDPEKALGEGGLLVVGHKAKQDGSKKAVINAITPLPEGTQCPPPRSKLLCYEIAHKSGGVFKELPEWLQKQISESAEFTKPAEAEAPAVATPAAEPPGKEGDDVPFS